MLKTEIQRKDGTRIIIEGTETEVRKVLSMLQMYETDAKGTSPRRRAQVASKLSIADLLLDLEEERFFNHPRSLVDIKNALAEKGRIYPVTTLSAQVIRLVRKRNLTRVRQGNKWMYLRSKENVRPKRSK